MIFYYASRGVVAKLLFSARPLPALPGVRVINTRQRRYNDMSSYKMTLGHSLCDGTGRDTYVSAHPLLVGPCSWPKRRAHASRGSAAQITCRPNTKVHVPMSKKLILGPQQPGVKRARCVCVCGKKDANTKKGENMLTQSGTHGRVNASPVGYLTRR